MAGIEKFLNRRKTPDAVLLRNERQEMEALLSQTKGIVVKEVAPLNGNSVITNIAVSWIKKQLVYRVTYYPRIDAGHSLPGAEIVAAGFDATEYKPADSVFMTKQEICSALGVGETITIEAVVID